MKLYLHEELMLLALRDEKGTLESRAGMWNYGLAGALLAELVLGGRVRLDEKKKRFVEPVSDTPFEDEVLDECLGLVLGAKRRKRARDWVRRFAGLRRLRHRVAAGLCRRDVLAENEKQVLLFFKRKVYPTIDPTPERELIERMRRVIFDEASGHDPRTAALVALAHGADMLRIHFDRRELRARKAHLEGLLDRTEIAEATREAVRAAQAAMMVAITAATVAATSAST